MSPRQEGQQAPPGSQGLEAHFHTRRSNAMPAAYQEWVEAMMSHHHKDWPIDYTPWSPSEDREGPSVPQETPGETR